MAGSLEFIKSETGTSVSSLSVTDCFSADYDVYYIHFDSDRTVFQTNKITFLDSSNTEITSASYDYANLRMPTHTTFAESRNTNQTSVLEFSYQKEQGNYGIYVFNPYDSSSYTFIQYQGMAEDTSTYYGYKGIAVLKSAEQCNGIKITSNSGNYDTIDLKIFGVK